VDHLACARGDLAKSRFEFGCVEHELKTHPVTLLFNAKNYSTAKT